MSRISLSYHGVTSMQVRRQDAEGRWWLYLDIENVDGERHTIAMFPDESTYTPIGNVLIDQLSLMTPEVKKDD